MLFAETTFSLPITDSAAEADTPFMTCVMLTTEAGVTLAVNITVELNTTDGTGKLLKGVLSMLYIVSLLSANGDDVDYQSLLNEPVMFYAGDGNGTERCANITLNQDLLVECEEGFNVTLAIASDKPNLILGNAYTTVSITDSEGMA